MSIVLKQNLCKESFSISSSGGTLTIKNGISGTTNFVKSTIVVLPSCSSGVICDDKSAAKADLLSVWGNVVDCCENSKKRVALDPKNFGFETVEELQNQITKTTRTPGEVLGITKATGLILGGKTVYKKAFRVSGFVSSDGFTHNLNIDNYLSVKIYSWILGNPSSKRELAGDGGQTDFNYGDLEVDTFDQIITNAFHDELLIILEYTTF